MAEDNPEDDMGELLSEALRDKAYPQRQATKNETPHLIGGEIIWANRDDEEVDAELYEMELNARDD